jgi:hypothetical protein
LNLAEQLREVVKYFSVCQYRDSYFLLGFHFHFIF